MTPEVGQVWRGWPGWGEGKDGVLCLVLRNQNYWVTLLNLESGSVEDSLMLAFVKNCFKERIA